MRSRCPNGQDYLKGEWKPSNLLIFHLPYTALFQIWILFREETALPSLLTCSWTKRVKVSGGGKEVSSVLKLFSKQSDPCSATLKSSFFSRIFPETHNHKNYRSFTHVWLHRSVWAEDSAWNFLLSEMIERQPSWAIMLGATTLHSFIITFLALCPLRDIEMWKLLLPTNGNFPCIMWNGEKPRNLR